MGGAGALGLKTSRRNWLAPLAGVVSILAGVILMVPGWLDAPDDGLQYDKLAELKSGDAGFPEIAGHFPAERVVRYRVGRREGQGVELDVVEFRDGRGGNASAMIYPPGQASSGHGDGFPRHELWTSTGDAILAHTPPDALFVSWWDNAQRIRFLSGREVWTALPAAGAFSDGRQRAFWRLAGGGLNSDETRLRQLARWLSMNAESALAEMAAVLPIGRPIYWLVCLDDLARLNEIEALSGVRLPFEARIFPPSDNIHTQIAEVRRWASESGVGSYLVHRLPHGAVRAWRITSEDGAGILLARLLPFTSSLAKPLDNQPLVHQTGWSGYLSIYQWRR